MGTRATGANVIIDGAFESTYGQAPASGYYRHAAYEFRAALQQNLITDPILGSGRDQLAPQRGEKDLTGQHVVPIDERLFGRYLRLMFGPPAASTQIGSRGYIEFTAQPVADTTIALNGTTWTFKASGATGPQTDIDSDLHATIDALVSDLNGSADTEVVKCTYTRLGNRLVVQHDTADTSGDTYTLATTVAGATVSGSTLVGGGLYRHEFRSAAALLPSMTFQVYHPDLDSGTYRYRIQKGCLGNTLTIQQQRSGSAKATIDVVGRDEEEATASVSGTPTEPTVSLLSQFNGVMLVDGAKIANVTGGNLVISNSLDLVQTLGDGGLIGGADPGQTSIQLSITARFGDNALRAAARAETPVSVLYGFSNPLNGAEMVVELNELHLPRPRAEIAGPGGIEVTYEAIGAKNVSIGRAFSVWLINDQASYA